LRPWHLPEAGRSRLVGKPSVANAEEAGHPARFGNDGNESTRWCAPDGTHGHTFRIDLGHPQPLTKANILWELPGIYRYRIEVSDDGANWRLAQDRSNNNVVAQRTEDALHASGRFVRLTLIAATKVLNGIAQEPGLRAISAQSAELGPEATVQRQAEFAQRMAKLSAELDRRD
jgi:hypothetical protein